VLTLQFETDRDVDHRAVVHLYTDSGILIRLPAYFHVSLDIVRFEPPIVDFGIIPWRFNVLRMPVSVKLRNTPGLNRIFLTEVNLPLNDERLDFVMGKWADEDWKRSSQQNEMILTKIGKNGNVKDAEVKNQRLIDLFKDFKGPIAELQTNSEGVAVITVLLDPYKQGKLRQEIEFVFVYEEEEGNGVLKSFKVLLPCIGYVGTQRNMLTSFVDQQGNEDFKPELVYEPAFEFTVSKYAVFNVPFVKDFCPIKSPFNHTIMAGLLMPPKEDNINKPYILHQDLYFYNTLVSNETLIDRAEIWNDNPEITFTHVNKAMEM